MDSTSLVKIKRYIIVSAFLLVFIFSLAANLPAWVLGNVVEKYSQGKLKIYNQTGTFWTGSGLFVAIDNNGKQSAPLLMINWKIRLGINKFVDAKFTIDNNQIAEVYLAKNGLNLDNLNLSLSISQVSHLVNVITSFGLSGNLNLSCRHMMLSSKNSSGTFNINLDNVSSNMSPVNPLGSYQISFDAENGGLNVSSNPNSALQLNGSGSIRGLNLKGSIDKTKSEKMLQFISVLGMPGADGTYNIKVF